MGLRDYRKYGAAAEQISRAIRSGHVSHAYIIEGNGNIDKKGFARAFAMALLCREQPGEGCGHCLTCRKILDGNYEDIFYLEPEGDPNKGTLSIKNRELAELQARLLMKPAEGDRNIAIIDGADYMTDRAQNRFLKTLEEPTPGTVIVLLSENTLTLMPTINSRCIHYRLTDLDSGPDGEMARSAADVLTRIREGALFGEITALLDQAIKDRRTANAWLDGLESTAGDWMRHGSGSFSRSWLIYCVECAEKARSGIRRNVSYKYAIRQLVLKLEEYEW